MTTSVLKNRDSVCHKIAYDTRAFRKVTSVHFRQLMKQRGKAGASEVASHDSLSYNITGHLVFVLVSTK
jgi:hypothetical protein